MVKFGYTILYVSNVSKSVEFYEKAFSFEKKFITPENDYGEIISGETTIAFASTQLANSNLKGGFLKPDLTNKPFGIELGLITDNVEELLEKAKKAGAMVIENPIQKPWGQTVAYIRDIDGFLIEICTPMS